MMLRSLSLLLVACGSAGLLRAEEPAPLQLKWRGSLWALGTYTDRETVDGSAFLRPMETGDRQFSLDGFQLGVDVPLGTEWAFKLTLMGGRDGRLLQEFSGETGTLGFPEAMLIWTRGANTVRIGRMWTWMGTESTDLTAAVPASHGLMATFPLPFGQVGLDWRHAWNPSWSTAVWLFNGEDRIADNNQGKTLGLGLIYNHGGAADRFMNFMAFSGAEKDRAELGAEGRKRERISHNGQWVWGGATVAWELEYLRERFAAGAVTGASGETTGRVIGAGLLGRYAWNPTWSAYVRAEEVRDNVGFKLNWDTTVASVYGLKSGADLTARALSLGVERRSGAAFLRLEFRRDWLNREVQDKDLKPFRAVNGLTLCVGASFSQ